MPVTLYELAGADPALRFSPYCWRTRLALAHKDLSVEGIAWRFTEKDRLGFSGQDRVPVLVDGEQVISDSWRIAEYLDDTYADRPTLLGSDPHHVRFINAWVDTIVHPAIVRLVLRDIHDVLAPVDQAYFRRTREAALGRTLEAVTADRDAQVLALRAVLTPVRMQLRQQPWLGGAEPDYADYILLGSLQWPRVVSRLALLEADDPVADWQRRGLALYDGLLANALIV